MLLRRGVEIFQQDAGFCDDAAGVDLLDLVHVAQVHDAAARQRHGLSVVTGARAAGGDGAVVGVAGLEDLDDLSLGAGADDEIGGDVVEPRLEDGRVPKEITAGGLDGGVLAFDVEMRKRGFGGGHVVLHCRSPIRWSSSE